MAKATNDPNKSNVVYISDDVRERWGLMKSEDFEMLNTEYLRQIFLLQTRTTNATESIKGWILFFGVLVILAGIFTFIGWWL